MTLCQTITLDFDHEMQATRKLLELVPLETHRDYQPHPRSMRLDRLASHVAELPAWLKMAVTTEILEMRPDFKPVIAATPKELLDLFDASVAQGREGIGAVSDAEMQKTWSFKYQGQIVYSDTRPQVIRSFLNHMVHHRAQLGVYLRLLDIKIPGMYGPSADEGFGS
jgi:uncharacterized damage-inducible protein DinB